jgi:K+-transporting ATPase c subunit
MIAVGIGAFAVTILYVVAKVLFPRQAAGSLVEKDGKIVGASLMGQNFTGRSRHHVGNRSRSAYRARCRRIPGGAPRQGARPDSAGPIDEAAISCDALLR